MEKWPENLDLDPGARTALEKACKDNPLPVKWPEEEKFLVCDQAHKMSQVLIPAFHSDITNAKIAYLMKEHVGGRGKTFGAKTTLSSSKLKFLAEVDFIIEINFTAWSGASVPGRAALLDHELCHCGRDENGKYCFVDHDIQEFGSVVRRWGLWSREVQMFSEVLKEQLELLEPATAQ